MEHVSLHTIAQDFLAYIHFISRFYICIVALIVALVWCGLSENEKSWFPLNLNVKSSCQRRANMVFVLHILCVFANLVVLSQRSVVRGAV